MTAHPFGPSSLPPVYLGDFDEAQNPRALVGFEVTGLPYGSRGVLYASFSGTTLPLALVVAPDRGEGEHFELSLGDGVLELTDSPVFRLSEHGVSIPPGKSWGLWGKDFSPSLESMKRRKVAFKPIYVE